MIPNSNAAIFLRVIGGVGTFTAWILVLRPRITVYWGRGENRARMSQVSKLSVAVAISGWSLGVFGFLPWLSIALFGIGFAGAAVSGQLDKERHAARTGRQEQPPTHLRTIPASAEKSTGAKSFARNLG